MVLKIYSQIETLMLSSCCCVLVISCNILLSLLYCKPCVVLFIGLINRCTEAVVKFTDAPEIFVVFFIG
jgi:hypothetical protein